jgi:predicted  nucleic acid-binding Zn-ribbon protein
MTDDFKPSTSDLRFLKEATPEDLVTEILDCWSTIHYFKRTTGALRESVNRSDDKRRIHVLESVIKTLNEEIAQRVKLMDDVVKDRDAGRKEILMLQATIENLQAQLAVYQPTPLKRVAISRGPVPSEVYP